MSRLIVIKSNIDKALRINKIIIVFIVNLKY